jgi:hypothetical protein
MPTYIYYYNILIYKFFKNHLLFLLLNVIQSSIFQYIYTINTLKLGGKYMRKNSSGRNKVIPDDEVIDEIKKLMVSNLSVKKIQEAVNSKLKHTYSRYHYDSFIKEIKNKGVQNSTEDGENNTSKGKHDYNENNLPGQISFTVHEENKNNNSDDIEVKSDIKEINKDSGDTTSEDTSIHIQSNITHNDEDIKVIDLLLNHIETLYKELKSINCEIKSIKKSISNIECNNPYEKLNEATDEFINIYSSRKNKQSISINSHLKDKVVQQIITKYNLQDTNDSLCVDIALLTALYHNKLKDPQD